jgi:pimeloyl-ACP methyl ester carboxylesterase
MCRALQLPAVLIIGNSVGGYAAARFASRHQGACVAIVLVNPGGFTPHNVLTRIFCRLQGSELVSRCAGRRMAGHYLHRRTPTVDSMLQRAAEVSGNPSRIRAHAAVWRSFAHPDHDLRAVATAICAPTYV